MESDDLKKLPRFEDESNSTGAQQPKILLTDADSHEMVLQGPILSFNGLSFTSKFESALTFKVDGLDLNGIRLRFRINFQIVDMWGQENVKQLSVYGCWVVFYNFAFKSKTFTHYSNQILGAGIKFFLIYNPIKFPYSLLHALNVKITFY